MPNRTRTIRPGSDEHKRIVSKLKSRVTMAEQAHNNKRDKWKQAEEIMLAYLPETDADAPRRAKRDAGQPSYTTIQIPYTYALVMTAHTYLTSVMFARNPVHQFAGWNGQGEDAVLALETLMNYQVVAGGMLGPYYIWGYDGLKYGTGIIGTYWDKETIQYGTLQAVEGEKDLQYTSQQVDGYEGQRGYNIAPVDFLPDPRVPVGQFQKGEFVVIKTRIAWNDLLRRTNQGFYTNLEHIRKNVSDGSNRQEDIGAALLERPQYFLMSDDEDEKVKHPSVVEAFEIYVDLVPKEWGLGASSYPEKWVFTVPTSYAAIIGCAPLGAMHGKFPFDVFESEIEAYGLYNRGLPEIIAPIQQTVDWLVNTHFFNVRSALNNQFILDPSRVFLSDAEKSSAGFVWRLRPEAYGTDVNQAIKQFPVSDVTQVHMKDMEAMFGIGQRMFGISDQIMGMLEPGGRKSATEVRTATGFGVNRLKTVAEYFSATAFSAHAQKMVVTSQQYFTQEKKLRIVGEQATFAQESFINVTPDAIAGQWDYVPVDGSLPIDRFAQATLWKDMMQQVIMIPQIAMQYDWARIFAWVAQIAGLRNIDRMKVQVVPDALMQQQAAAGNSIPLGPGAPGGTNASSVAGSPSVIPGALAGQRPNGQY